MELLKNLDSKILNIWLSVSGYIKLFWVTLLVSILSYLVLISNELTNTYDGMWKGTMYPDHGWPISIGRWFWPYIGMARRDLSPEPFTSIFSLALFVLAGCLIVYMFNCGKDIKWISYLIVLMVSVNSGVSVCLSYRYMSPTFGVGFLTSIIAIMLVWFDTKYEILRLLAAICFVVGSTASYQDYIGCSCVLVLMLFIQKLQNGRELKEAFLFIIKSALVLLLGCIVYKFLWEIVLSATNITAASYKGADSLTIKGIIINLPSRIADAYKAWINYFGSSSGILRNAFQGFPLYKVIFLFMIPFLVIMMIIFRTYKSSKENFDRFIRIIIILVSLSLLPPAANAAMLLSPQGGDMMIQMIMPLVIIFPILTCIIFEDDIIKTIPQMLIHALIAFVICLSFYGNFLQVSTDQHIMLQSREEALAYMNRVFYDLESKDMITSENGIVFIGRPVDSPLYRKDEVWDFANDYAKYGEFWMGGNCCTQSYYGILRDLGYNVYLNWNDSYWHELEEKDEIKEMPCYPHEGYAKYIDGSIVVKLS